jgi:hypothetical protein
MSIQNIKDSKTLQKYCDKLGREGMYEMVLDIANKILIEDKTPQEVMMYVGEIKALAIGSKCDGYWNEKVEHGYHRFINHAEYENTKTN